MEEKNQTKRGERWSVGVGMRGLKGGTEEMDGRVWDEK